MSSRTRNNKPAGWRFRVAEFVIPPAAATVAAVKASTDLGLGGIVDLAVNGQWDLWILAVYGVGLAVSVPLTVAGWVLVILHITRPKGQA